MRKKTLFLFIFIILSLFGCKKDDKPVVKGGTYRIKSGIFSPGAFQPRDTLYANSIYFNQAEGLLYCECLGPANFDVENEPLVKGQIAWYVPVDDLK